MRWGFSVECGENTCKATTYAENKVPGIPLVTVFESDHLLVLVVGRLYYTQDWRSRLVEFPASDAKLVGSIYEQLGTPSTRRT